MEQGVDVGVRHQALVSHGALYLFAALVAALGAPNKYALKIYDWLVVFTALFLTSQTARSSRTFLATIFILVAGGVIQAVLGLFEYAVGLDRVMRVLQTPIAEIFLQPNLLRERLPFLSFNWVTDGRVLPFGSFINAIDYSIFLAALTMLALTLALSRPRRVESFIWLAGATVMTLALLFTFKASGFLAIVAGALALAILWAPRLSRRMVAVAAMLFLVATIFAALFSNSIVQRAAFLLQREQNQSLMTGRTQIWLRLMPAFMERPLFGYGLNNADVIAEPTRTLQNGVFGLISTAPESSYVGTLVETGVIGFVALMSFFAMALKTAYRRARAGMDAPLFAGVFAALVAILVGNLTVSGFTTDQNGMLMGVLIGLVFAEWKNQ
jgi:O-antigen ligase